jgi:hypothetical protein
MVLINFNVSIWKNVRIKIFRIDDCNSKQL